MVTVRFNAEPDTDTFETRHGPMLALRGDRFVTRSLELYGEFSGEEERLFEQIVRSGMSVVEVGANIGAHTVPLARLCAPGPLYAFEPQQRVFQILCANLALNNIHNVIAYPDAVGAEAGHVLAPKLNYARSGNYGGVSMLPPGSERGGLRTRVVALDTLELAACHLIKIDVEGFEPHVLRGARQTIARHRPLLYVENDRPANQQEVISLIDELGYRQYWHTPPLFDPKNPKRSSENVFRGIVSVNLICMPKERGGGVTDAEPIDPANWQSPVRE